MRVGERESESAIEGKGERVARVTARGVQVIHRVWWWVRVRVRGVVRSERG